MDAAPTRDEWLSTRKTGIGGSDIHHVFSEAPWGCARRLWFDKRDVPPDYPQEETAAMLRGTRLEGIVADLYAERTGRVVATTDGAIVHPEHPWARVNIDREIEPQNGSGPGVLEIKTHAYWPFKKVQKEGLAAAHILQLQHALLVTGYQWGAFAILHPDSWTLLSFDVQRDDALVASIVDAGARFWHQVEHGPMPEALPEIDSRCKGCPWRRTCRGGELLKAAGITDDDQRALIEAAEDLAPLLADYRQAKALADDAEVTLDQIKEAIRMALGTRQAVECDGSKIYYREQVSQRWDTKALDVAHPELAAQFKRSSVSRPLKIYL